MTAKIIPFPKRQACRSCASFLGTIPRAHRAHLVRAVDGGTRHWATAQSGTLLCQRPSVVRNHLAQR